MKIVAFSDIHANLPALEAVLEDISKHGNDVQLIIAGDLLNCGPFPRETLARLRALPNAHFIAGNHEEYILEKRPLSQGEHLPVPYRALFAPAVWTANQLTPEDLEWLAALPRSLDLPGPEKSLVRVVHGSPRHQTEGLTNALDDTRLSEIFRDHTHPSSLWISGHTHDPALIRWQGMTITNCGSVGLPYDGDYRPSYLLAEWDEKRRDWYVEHRRVAYDRDLTLRAIEANSAYDQGGPFMRLMYYNVKLGRPCNIKDFVNRYLALREYPAPPEDFTHLDRAVDAHLAQFAA